MKPDDPNIPYCNSFGLWILRGAHYKYEYCPICAVPYFSIEPILKDKPNSGQVCPYCEKIFNES